MKGINLDFYIFPYIEYRSEVINVEGTDIQVEYGEDSDFALSAPLYYIPKDCHLSDISVYDIPLEGKGISSRFINERGVQGEENGLEKWLNRISFALQDYFSFVITANIENKHYECLIQKDSIIKPDEITIPSEKIEKINVGELIDTYMRHPMFDETDSIKEFFYNILSGNNLLNYTLTKSSHFLDDYFNVRTCYLSNLIQSLKMMGEDVLEYEKGAFEGVNDLRDFVRILSINHSDLVGKMVKQPYDIEIRLDNKGKNVGDEIFVDDILNLQTSDSKFCKGKIIQLTRDGETYDFTKNWNDGVDIIVHDKYSNETKIVNFRNSNKSQLSILDYEPSWGWNLLLSNKYNDCLYKLQKNKEYADKNNGVNLYSSNELNRLKQVLKDHIRGYYGFYVLIPDIEVIRKGNFLEENTIIDKIDNPQEWGERWGITHEILMKIIRDNGSLKNTEVAIENDDIQRVYSRRTMTFDDLGYTGIVDDELSSINSSLYSQGLLQHNVTFDNVLKIYGCICGSTEDYLELQFEGIMWDKPTSFVELKSQEDILQFKLKVDENGVIHPSKQVYKLYSDGYEGTLTVSLCGKLKKEKGRLTGFLWDVSVDMYSIK